MDVLLISFFFFQYQLFYILIVILLLIFFRSQPSWFSCLRLLFSIDHKLLEIHQVIALRAVLTEDSNETKELAESKLEFFREVCDTYLKLRQVSHDIIK